VLYIKEVREKSGKSQKECAEYVGVTQKTLSQWEQGKGAPTCETVIKLAELFNTTINELCFGEDPCVFLSQLRNIQKDDAKKIIEALDLLAESEPKQYENYLKACKDVWWNHKK